MRRLAPILGVALALAVVRCEERPVTDAAGRVVELPERIERVFPAGPPAAITVYMLAPETLVGWTRAPSPSERAFLPQRYAELPELGRLTGRGNTVNLEAVLRAQPSLVLDIGAVAPTYASLADRVQEQTKLPAVLIDGRLANTPATLRDVGALLGVAERGETLARYAEATLAEMRRRSEAVPAEKRLRVYVARGPRGLETAIAGSINAEALDFVAAHNVAAEGMGAGGLVTVSMEQLLAWQPDVVIAFDRGFFESVASDPLWAKVKAVREKRVYLAPTLPFGWVDVPPAANRLIGVRWLGKVLYPELFPEDLRAETRRFYGLFYHQEPSEQQLDELLASTTAPR
jgi:iron complex transport system substrate-binding protein